MRINSYRYLGIIGFAMVVFIGCSKPREAAIGYDHVITVVSEADNWEACEPILNETLGRTIYTPWTEQLYSFQRIDPSDLNVNILNKNLLILTRLEVYSEVMKQVRAMLPDSTIQRMWKNPRGYYKGENAYADGQALIIVAGKSLAELRSRLKVNQEEILSFVERKMFERNTAFVYRSGEQFKLAESYYQQHGFYLRMMHDYVEIENSPSKKLVWLGRDFPYRWLTISWATPDDISTLETQSDRLLRNTLGTKIPDVRINEDHLIREEVWFKSYSGFKYFGLWEMKDDVKGGPFVAYSFYEPVKDRIYVLAGTVHAPDRNKMPYIRQAETILRTFDTDLFAP